MALTQIQQAMLQDGILTADAAGRLKMADGFVNDAKISGVAASKVSGQLADSNMAPGSVLQVIQAAKTDTFSTTSFCDNPSVITGLSASITPQNPSSKILISGSIVASGQYGYTQAYIRIYKDGSPIGIGQAVGNRPGVTSRIYNEDNGVAATMPFEFLDSPNTSSTVTYDIRIGTEGNGTVFVNRTPNDSDNRGGSRGISTMVLTEIAG